VIVLAQAELRPVDLPTEPARFGGGSVAEHFEILQVIPLRSLAFTEGEHYARLLVTGAVAEDMACLSGTLATRECS
jgi:hypothetical protein